MTRIENALRASVVDAPPCLLVSVPKSGTHLGIKLLELLGLRRALPLHKVVEQDSHPPSPAGERVDPEDPMISVHGVHGQVSTSRLRRVLREIGRGGFTHGHVPYSPEAERLVLQELGFRVVLMVRDPRAIACSTAEWLVDEKRGAPIDPAFQGTSFDDRLDTLLGAPTSLEKRPTISQELACYLSWRSSTGILVVRFEDLVGSRGGGSDHVQRTAILEVAAHLGLQVDESTLEWVMANLFGGTGTFRHGQVERWRSFFGPARLLRAKKSFGVALSELGYESEANVDLELERQVKSIRWYHTIDLGNGIVTPGLQPDPEAWLATMGIPENLEGKTVLDIHAWDGACAFEAYQRGAARVLATDSYVWDCGMKEGFLLARSVLAPEVEDMNVDILDLDPEKAGGTFDLVLFLGVLYHMRHPLLALERVFSVTGDMAIVETATDMLDVDRPAIAFYPGTEYMTDPTNWCGPNPAAVMAMLEAVGFGKTEVVHQTAVHYRTPNALVTESTRTSPEQIPTTRLVVHAWK